MGTPKRYENWYALGGVLIRPNQLIIEVNEPNASNTGVQPYFEAGLDDVTDALTLFTSDDEIIEGYNFLGRVEFRADNVTLRNCRIRGQNSAPSDGTALVNAHHSSHSNAKILWCDIWPQYPHWNWDHGVYGFSYTLEFCHIRETTDNVSVFNANIVDPLNNPYFTNVVIRQNYFENVALWTASSGGIVHPQDPVTHNDTIQHQGGRGTHIRGNAFKTYYKRQYAHWQCVGDPAVEPYVGVALQSLPAGAPRFGGPFYAGGNSALSWGATNTLADRGSGTEATGRYNGGSLSGLQIGQNVGKSYDLEVWGNWFYGSGIAINGGGNTYPGNNEYLGSFLRNKFSRDQCQQDIGGNFTHTINVDTAAEPGWTGHFDAPTTGVDRNKYMTLSGGSDTITVRS